MSDLSATFKAQREDRQEAGAANRDQAGADFPGARGRIQATEMRLFCHSETHYSLRGRTWLINIYPGNRRIVRGPGAPWLELPAEWTLLDIATAVETMKGEDDGCPQD